MMNINTLTPHAIPGNTPVYADEWNYGICPILQRNMIFICLYLKYVSPIAYADFLSTIA